MNDREMLELAAKACGFITRWVEERLWVREKDSEIEAWRPWNASDDDGDCARMEATLLLNIEWNNKSVMAVNYLHRVTGREFYDDHSGKQDARRIASLRAAAEIGRSTP